jgi:hypothetical protein
MAVSALVIFTFCIVNLGAGVKVRVALSGNKIKGDELLIGDPQSESTSVYRQVSHKPTGSILHKDSLMLIPTSGGQLEIEIYEARRLANLG